MKHLFFRDKDDVCGADFSSSYPNELILPHGRISERTENETLLSVVLPRPIKRLSIVPLTCILSQNTCLIIASGEPIGHA